MDKLIETKRERFWNPEAWIRDQWIKAYADKLAPGSKVLDAGAGASKYRPFFSHCDYKTQDFCQYEGPLVKYLQPVDYVCDIRTIPILDASLDVIVCTEVIEHLPDPMAALNEFSRILKPGGRLLLTAPHGTFLHMEPYHYYGGFTVFWYRHWLPKFGLEIEEIIPQSGQSRAVVSFLQGFYNNWREYEKTLVGFSRLASLGCRMVLKLPVHYVIPWVFSKLDSRLDPTRMCIGLMVAGIKKSRT